MHHENKYTLALKGKLGQHRTIPLLFPVIVVALSAISLFAAPVIQAAPTVQDIASADELVTYHHEPYGIIFSYPADWKLETFGSIPIPTPEYLPEGYGQIDVEGNQTFGNTITLYPPSFAENPLDEIYIAINSHRISASGDLSTTIALQIESNRLNSPSTAIADAATITVTRKTYAEADDAVVVSSQSPYGRSEAIWLAKDGLIYGVVTASQNPDVISAMHELVSTLKFDGTTEELFERYKKYTSDADALRTANEALRPQPPPECDIVCRDAKERGEGPALSATTSSSSGPQLQQPTVQAAAINVSGNQKALPATWPAPVLPTSSSGVWPVLCGSSFHTGNAEFATDISAWQYEPRAKLHVSERKSYAPRK